MLGPRQRLSVDVAFGHTSEYRSVATDNNRRVSETVIEPVFFADRSPTLEAHYHGVWMRTEDDLRSEFALQLADPTGDDLACFERLKADPRLARCLYDLRAIPDAAQVSLLEEIIKSWPRSSYADLSLIHISEPTRPY